MRRLTVHRLGASVAAVLLLVAVLALWLAWRPLARAPARGAGTGAELLLFCGAGLQPLADALIEEFSARAGVRVAVTYAGSGQLLGQLEALPRGDLFLPGAEFYVQRAVALGLVGIRILVLALAQPLSPP